MIKIHLLKNFGRNVAKFIQQGSTIFHTIQMPKFYFFFIAMEFQTCKYQNILIIINQRR